MVIPVEKQPFVSGCVLVVLFVIVIFILLTEESFGWTSLMRVVLNAPLIWLILLLFCGVPVNTAGFVPKNNKSASEYQSVESAVFVK